MNAFVEVYMSVIIYGAGQYGHYAYWEYIDKKEILCCIDRDMSIRGDV